MVQVVMFILLGVVLTGEFVSFKQHRRREEEYQLECYRLLQAILSVVVKPNGDPDDA